MLKVDGVDLAGKSLSDAVNMVLGPAGTKVTITFKPP
jgi:C-terminal processing protease CtpA/Prc